MATVVNEPLTRYEYRVRYRRPEWKYPAYRLLSKRIAAENFAARMTAEGASVVVECREVSAWVEGWPA